MAWRGESNGPITYTVPGSSLPKSPTKRITPGGAYYRVMHRNIRDMHAAIAETGILYTTLMVHEGWDRPGPETTKLTYVLSGNLLHLELPIIARKGRADGGHAVAVVGYTRDGFVIQNSWGESWGNGGFALLPYEDWMLHDCNTPCLVRECAGMGDITTHKEINYHVIPQLEAITAPENYNYTYVEFGNFLTDIAQFRDPVAYFGAKQTLRAVAIAPPAAVFCGLLGGFLGTGGLSEWLNVICGKSKPYEKRHGALATFFQHLGRAFAHIKFADDSDHYDKNLDPLPAAEIDRVYAWAYTQYYPHEHLDYPPFREGIDPVRTKSYRPLKRRLMGYLEQHTQFISEELSRIEFDWVKNRNLPATHPTRCDLLVRLGHILHAVEDFYFHSNAVELRQWNRVLQANPDRKPNENEGDYRFIVNNSLIGTSHDTSSVRLRRRLARRLRYPIFVEDAKIQPDESFLALDYSYTGGFGKTDIAHTLSGGLRSLEASFNNHHPGLAALIPSLPIPLLKVLLIENERRMIAGDCQILESRMKQHRQQIEFSGYIPLLGVMRANGTITEAAETALLEAFNLDREIELAYDMPGPGGFLILWLTRIQKEADESHEKAQDLDGDADSMYDPAAENGASEETIGTHSLLAKDSTEKDPLRKEAMTLAKFASAALAVTLLQRIRNEPDPARGLNWDLLIRHFVRIPPGKPNSWEEEVLDAVNAGKKIPTLDSIQDKPNFGMITSGGLGGTLTERREGGMKGHLESRYLELERRAELGVVAPLFPLF